MRYGVRYTRARFSRGPWRPWSAVGITTCDPRDNRGLMVYGRVLGGEDEEILSSLSSLINRRNYSLHLCGGDPCR